MLKFNNVKPGLQSNHKVFIAIKDQAQLDFESLTPDEKNILESFKGQLRKEQFCLGRQAAKAAMSGLLNSTENITIASAPDGAPVFPDDLCGSISHARYYSASGKTKNSVAVSVVGLKSDCISLGIDIEHSKRNVTAGFSAMVARPTELEWLAGQENIALISLVSAKETLYKLLYPLYGKYFGFKEAELFWDAGTSGFNANYFIKLPKNSGVTAPVRIHLGHWQDFVISYSYISKKSYN